MKYAKALILILLLVATPVHAAQTHSTDLEVGSLQSWSIADASQTGLDFTGNHSICGWYKFETLPASGASMYLVTKYNSNGVNQRAYILSYRNQAGTLRFEVLLSNNGTAVTTAVFNHTLSTGTWYHICYTYSTAGTAKVYVDNTEVSLSSGSAPTSIFNSNATFYIGSLANGASSEDYDGLVDEVLAYSTTLDTTAISNLFSSPCSPSSTNLVSQWSFNDNGNDSVGSNNLTNNNSATFSTDTPFVCAAATGLGDILIFD